MSWFEGLLGKIFSSGTEIELGNGINFRNGLTATANPVTGRVDIDAPALASSTSIVVGADDIQRAAITGAVEIAQDSNASVFGASALGSGLSGSGTAVAKYAGTTSTGNVSSTSGDLNVVDITALECGGVYTLQNLSEANIDGFTAKTDGFWFVLHVRDDASSASVSLIENSGDTTTSIRTPDIRDWRLTKNDSVMLIYNNSRWRVVASYPKPFFNPTDNVTWAAQQDNFTRASRGIEVLRVTLTGNQNLSGVVPDGVTPGGEMLIISNVDTADTLTILHDSTSTAANRFFCPGAANMSLAPHNSALCRYDSTSSRWRIISRS